jgi:hypothetical protein
MADVDPNGPALVWLASPPARSPSPQRRAGSRVTTRRVT